MDTALKRFQIGLEDGFTSGANSVYNGGSPVAAKRRLAVDKAVSADWVPTFESPVEARGAYAGTYTNILHQMQATGKLPCAVYADDLVYLFRMLISGVPTVTALKPTSAAILPTTANFNTAVTSESFSATTQPNAMADIPGGVTNVGKKLELILANTVANTQQISVQVTGTDVYSNVLTETVVFSLGTTTASKVGGGSGATSCTLYSQNYFRTINASGIVVTSALDLPAETLTINAVNAFQWKFVADMATSTIQSGTVEYFDGGASWQLPGTVMSKADITAQIGKSLAFSGSFDSKQKLQLAATAASINPAANAGDLNALTNLADHFIQAIPTYKTLFLAGDMGSNPDTGLTAINARLGTMKISFDNAITLDKTADGTPYPTFVSRDYYGDKMSAVATLLFNSYSGATADPLELAKFLNAVDRTVRTAFPGPPMLCGALSAAGNWPTNLQQSGVGGYYGFQIDMAGRWTLANENMIGTRPAFDFTLSPEVDLVSMNAPYQALVISSIDPNS